MEIESKPSPTNETLEHLLDAMIEAAMRAEPIILDAFAKPREADAVENKIDGTEATLSDKASEVTIRSVLTNVFPNIPIIGEETSRADSIPEHATKGYFLVDPLDGTREFRDRRPDFTVNVAYVVNGKAIIGVMLAPAHGELFTGSPKGAFKSIRAASGGLGTPQPISVRPRGETLEVIVSAFRSNDKLERYLANLKLPFRHRKVGSLLKVCRIAEGNADLYPCPLPTNAWDTAASQAILEAAGGHIVEWSDDRIAVPLTYEVGRFRRQGNFSNPDFIAHGGARRNSRANNLA